MKWQLFLAFAAGWMLKMAVVEGQNYYYVHTLVNECATSFFDREGCVEASLSNSFVALALAALNTQPSLYENLINK